MIPPNYRRASGFTLSRILAGNSDNASLPTLASDILEVLHRPLLHSLADKGLVKPSIEHEMTASVALTTLQALLLNTDPSPTIISSLLTPIIPSIYSLSSHLFKIKTSSPSLKETVTGFLTTWGRTVTQSEGVNTLWSIISGEGGEWKSNIEGEIERTDM